MRPEQTEVLPLLYTVEQAARALSMSRSKAYQLVIAGVIPSIKIDGMRRVPRLALEQRIEQILAKTYDPAAPQQEE